MDNYTVKPYVDGENLMGRLMCYRCHYSFPAPKVKHGYVDVKCPNCNSEDEYQHHKCHYLDPNRNPLGWPYDDPTIPYDC